MDDESAHKPDGYHSLTAKSHGDHLNDSVDEETKQQQNMAEDPYGNGTNPSEQVMAKHEMAGQPDLSNAKKQALVLMLSISNEKYGSLRSKNRCFNKWREVIRQSDTFALQLELSRLNKEVDTVKFQESLLRTNFRVQKAELESKINMLVSLI